MAELDGRSAVQGRPGRPRLVLSLVIAALLIGFFALIVLNIIDWNPAAPGRRLFHAERPEYIKVLTGLPRDFQLVLFMFGFLLSGAGPGAVVLKALRVRIRDELERLLLGVAVGLIVYTFAFAALAWMMLLQPAPLVSLLALSSLVTVAYAIGAVARLLQASAGASQREAASPGAAVAAVLLTVGILFLAYTALIPALGPEVQFDASWYHLGAPYHYALHHGFFDIVRVTHILATGVPFYQEMLYSGLIPVVGVIGAKLLHWADAVLTAVFLVYFCRVHLGSARVGLLAGLIFLGTPVVTWSMGTGSNDLPLALYGITSLHAFLRWREDRALGWLVLAGTLAGYSIGVKPFGAIVAMLIGVAALGYTVLERPRFTTYLARAGALSAAVILPCVVWFIRAYQLTGDPVYPALYHLFKTPYWNDLLQSRVNTGGFDYSLHHNLVSFLRLPFDATFSPLTYFSVIGPLYLLSLPAVAAMAIWARGRLAGTYRLLLLFAFATTAAWFAVGSLEIRYDDAALPVSGAVIAFACYELCRRLRPGWPVLAAVTAVLAVATVIDSPLIVEVQRDSWIPGEIRGRGYVAWDYVYGHQTVQQARPLPVEEWFNTHLSASRDKVFDDNQQIANYLYSNVEMFDGGSPDALGWRLTDPDALAHLRQEHVTYMTLSGLEIAQLESHPLYRYLKRVYSSAPFDTWVVKIEYPS